MGDFAEAGAGLDVLVEQCRISGRQQFLTQFIMLKAAVAHRSGQSKAARAHVLDALTLGRRLGLVRSLLDADQSALSLIRNSATDERLDPLLTFYVERLSQAAPQEVADGAPSLAKAAGKVMLSLEPLSEREIDVVKLLAKALPNKTIARTLGLSPETVKWHLKNIYGKLGVSGRDDAIARMRDIDSA
jgi:LuxR family maltose regulon positive regulatory protein